MENIDTKTSSWYIEEKHMETFIPKMNNRQTETAVTSLAVVGFVALVAAGIWLAVYATRYVPAVVNGVGEAAVSAARIVPATIEGINGAFVYLGSIFTPAPEPSLSVVSTSTVIYFGEATTTPVTAATTTPAKPIKSEPSAGAETSGSYQISGTAAPAALYGLSDLTVNITAAGYLTAPLADSFVASFTVPAGSRPAVRFTIKNIGTNVTGLWRFSATIPTQTAYIYQSQMQQSLAPGDSIDYTLGFDQANRGTDQTISITANFDRAAAESNTNNNSDSTKVTIIGG